MKLNNRVLIQERVNGGPLKDIEYKDFKSVWANISNLHGKEFIQAQSINPNISKKIIIRYIKELDSSINKDISKKYRIKYKNNFYNILYSDNIKERNKFLELMLNVE